MGCIGTDGWDITYGRTDRRSNFSDCITLKKETLRLFETPVITRPRPQRDTPETSTFPVAIYCNDSKQLKATDQPCACTASFIHSGLLSTRPSHPVSWARLMLHHSVAQQKCVLRDRRCVGEFCDGVGISCCGNGWVCEIQQLLAHDLKSASWYFWWLLMLPLWRLPPPHSLLRPISTIAKSPSTSLTTRIRPTSVNVSKVARGC
jgi:hypothetical protein